MVGPASRRDVVNWGWKSESKGERGICRMMNPTAGDLLFTLALAMPTAGAVRAVVPVAVRPRLLSRHGRDDRDDIVIATLASYLKLM